MIVLIKTCILILCMTPGYSTAAGLSGYNFDQVPDRSPDQAPDPLLPDELSETEAQSITSQGNPKSRVSAALKISDNRINLAYRLLSESQYKSAAQEVDVYSALVRYADNYTRKLPGSKQKDRNNCFKVIEQSIFKNTRTFEAILRDLPLNYREPAERSIEEIRNIRLRAINDLLGGGKFINSSND